LFKVYFFEGDTLRLFVSIIYFSSSLYTWFSPPSAARAADDELDLSSTFDSMSVIFLLFSKIYI
jgi:hypothetical protein